MAPNHVLECENLSKSYGMTQALQDVSLSIKAGERTAIVGNNGAGKSTFLNLAIGFINPTSGSICIEPNFSYLPQVLKFPGFLKVKDVVQLMEVNARAKLPPSIYDEMGLSKIADRYTRSLSGGEERKLAFAISLLGKKSLIILDEPTANVDLVSRKLMHKILHEYCGRIENRTLVFSSHDMSDIEHLADRIIIFHNGRVVADGAVSEIKSKFSPMRITFIGPEDDIKLDSALKSSRTRNRHVFYGSNSDHLLKDIIRIYPNASNIEIERSSLEEALVHIWEQQ